MNIGLLSFEYPPETGFGGIGTYTWYQARALARLGHDVHVVAGLQRQSPLSTLERGGITVHRYRPGGRIMSLAGGFGRSKCWWTQQRVENGWSMYSAVKALQRRYRFDILEMPECGAEGLLLNPLTDIPAVVRFHSPSELIMPFYDVPRADVKMCSWLERRAIRNATALTACSRFLACEARSKMGIRTPIHVIPNGIDLELFDRESAGDVKEIDIKEKFGLPRDRLTIFFAGRMERRKGIHLCGEIAASILRDYEVAFVFAGQDLFGYMTDTLLPSLRDKPLKGSIHYLGKLDLKEVRSCLRASEIFLLPSVWENMPYSCLEAMAAGRAIAASAQGGVPEMIEHGRNGLLAKSEDPESFIQQLRILLEDESLRCRFGRAARKTVEELFTDDSVARRSVEFYESVINRRRVQEARTR
jgi:glycosyltransferase involved in cell wall biosynthesis